MEFKLIYILVIVVFFNYFGASDSKFGHINDCSLSVNNVYSRWSPGSAWLTFMCNTTDNEQTIFTDEQSFHCSYHPVNHSESAFRPGTIYFKDCRFPKFSINFLAKFPNIHTFNISDIALETLQMNIFAQGKHLTNLIASKNLLTEIPSSVFFAAKNLTFVDFANNNIKRVDSFAFKGANKLEVLNLSQNALTELDEYMFLDMMNLNLMNLSHNKISELDFNILPFNLTVLDLSANKISTLEKSFKKIVKLSYLNLAFNPIKNVNNETLAKMPDLEYLNLKQTHLSSLQLGTFSHQQKLVTLDLSENRFKELNFNVFILPTLESLHLNGNQLKDLMEFAHQLFPQLAFLDVRGNYFNCSYLRQFLKSINSENIQLPIDPEASIEPGHMQILGIECELTDERAVVMEEPNHEIELPNNDVNEKCIKLTQECDCKIVYLYGIIIICLTLIIFLILLCAFKFIS